MSTEAERIMPWMHLQVEYNFQLLCNSKNLSQRGGVSLDPNREIQVHETGQRKKPDPVVVSCDKQG